MRRSLVFFMIFAATAIISGEELETRKTVKKAAAVENEVEARTDEMEMTVKVEVVKETTSSMPESTKKPEVNVESGSTKKPEMNVNSGSTGILEMNVNSESTKKPEVNVGSGSNLNPESTNNLDMNSKPENTVNLDMNTRPESTVNLEMKPITEKIPEITPVTEKLEETESTSQKLPENSLNESMESGDDDLDQLSEVVNIVPVKDPSKRKVLFLNQQQNGKLNVHLELSDVSVIVIPKNKDPQLSLLNLLFKSAQKSNLAKKKEEEMKVEVNHHDEYSKYKPSFKPAEDNFRHHHFGSTMPPFIESRVPYKVDISSTLGQQSPAVEITSHSQPQHQIARSPIMQLLKPIPFTIQTAPGNRIFKRSIDSRLLGIDDEIPSDDDELTESIFNSLDKKQEFNGLDRDDGTEFVLLGATENCGPGRRRNSYQICVAVDYE